MKMPDLPYLPDINDNRNYHCNYLQGLLIAMMVMMMIIVTTTIIITIFTTTTIIVIIYEYNYYV